MVQFIHSPLESQGASRLGIEAPEPVFHRAPPHTMKRARRILRHTKLGL